jgi:hypothetical protein
VRAEVRAERAESVAHQLREWIDLVSDRLDDVLTRSDLLTGLLVSEGEPRDLSQLFRSSAARQFLSLLNMPSIKLRCL